MFSYDDQIYEKLDDDPKNIKIVPLASPIPEGWRILTLQEGIEYKDQLIPMLGTWSIVAFDKGKLDGSGYGNKISQNYGQECGEIFIIKHQQED